MSSSVFAPPVTCTHRRWLSRTTGAVCTTALVALGGPVASADVDYTGCAWVAQSSLSSGVNFTSYEVVLAGERVVYVGYTSLVDAGVVYSAPVDGSGPPVQLSGTSGPGLHGATGLVATPDGSHVVYARETVLGRADVYAAPSDGSGVEILLTPGGDATTFAHPAAVTPDSARLVFYADRIVDGQEELFSVPLDGSSPPLRLTAAPVANGDVESHFGVTISPDGSRVVYVGDLLMDSRSEIFSAPVAAEGGQVRLNDDPAVGGEVDPNYELTPDGSRVVYMGDLSADDRTIVYSAPIAAAGGEVELSPFPVGPGVRSFEITPDSTRVVFVSAYLAAAVEEVFSAPIATAGQTTELSSGATDSRVAGMALTPTGSHVVYTADMLVDERFDLYSAPVGSSGGQAALASSSVGDVIDAPIYQFTQDGATVVFFGRLDSSALDVYSATVGTSGSYLRLSSGGTSGILTEGLALTPDEARVVYVGDFAGVPPGGGAVFSAPLGVAGAQVQLSSVSVGPPLYLQFPHRFTADGRWVLYAAHPAGPDAYGLYAARVDAAGTEVPLTAPDVAFATIGALAGTNAVVLAEPAGSDGPVPLSVWLGDADGDGTFDTCDADLVPQVASVTATRTTFTVTFDRATNQPALTGLDAVLIPPAGHAWGAATTTWASPATLLITRASDTTVALGDALDFAAAATLRAPRNRSPLLVGPVASIGLCAPVVPAAPFVDISASFAMDDIKCLYGAGIVAGTSATTYSPELAVTREQMAIYLMGAHETALGVYTGPANHPFTDVGGSYALTRIGQLANLGITAGTSPTTYGPTAPVTRAQMAVFLVRLYEAITGASPAAANTPFTDISGSFAETPIRQLLTLGVTAGTSATSYGPDQAVTREQMAVFVVRLLEAT